jgi:hypothetical protein
MLDEEGSMSDNIAPHPHRDLMAEAKHEREVADSPEAQALQAEIYKAVKTPHVIDSTHVKARRSAALVKGKQKSRKERRMTDDDFTDEEVAFALRELERLGLVESRMGDDGQIYYRRTGKELTDEISVYKPGRSQ